MVIETGARFKPRRGVALGAIGFALGLAVAGAIYGSMVAYTRDAGTALTLASTAFALAGAIGGAVIGVSRGSRGARRDALATALALGNGLFLTGILYSAVLEPRLVAEWTITAIYVVRFGAIGTLVGLLLAGARGDWKRIPELAAAGGLGFALGALILDRVATWLAGPLTVIVPGYIGDPLHDSIARAITWAIAFAAAGLFAGASIGRVLDTSDEQAGDRKLVEPGIT